MSVGSVALVTGGLLLLDRSVAVTLVPIAYPIPVVVAATKWDIWASTLASIASMVAADFFFFPPIYSLQVGGPQEAIHLLLFLVVALVSSNLASRLRRETEMLRQREREIQLLFAFSRRLAACFTISDLISAIETYLSAALGKHGPWRHRHQCRHRLQRNVATEDAPGRGAPRGSLVDVAASRYRQGDGGHKAAPAS
jgi:two-component system sensor histidine kinase KdpD